MTPYKSKKSFKTWLVIAISIVNLAVILAITYLTYRWNAQQLQEQTITQTQQTIEQAGTNVSTYMDELYRLTLTPYYNDEVLSQLEYSPTNSRDKLNSKRIVEGFLSSVMTLPRSEILRVYIANDDSLYSYTRTPNDMPDLATYASVCLCHTSGIAAYCPRQCRSSYGGTLPQLSSEHRGCFFV